VASTVQRQLCTVEDIMGEARRLPRNGTGFLRRAMAEASDGARSVAEAHAADRLKRARLPSFELNAVVVDAERLVRYVVDFLWRSLRAVLEIDSREFHFSAADWAATTIRHNALISLGYSVVHYPPSAVDQPGWAADVGRWLRRRAADLGVPWPPT
jgi:very-short-patch-repair endonuclease